MKSVEDLCDDLGCIVTVLEIDGNDKKLVGKRKNRRNIKSGVIAGIKN